jgi:hypothetical protein
MESCWFRRCVPHQLLEKSMTYKDHVWEGFVLTVEVFAFGMVAVCGCFISVLGAPFWLVSKVSGRYFDQVNEEQINNNLL